MAYQLASADISHALDALASEHERIARALAQVGIPRSVGAIIRLLHWRGLLSVSR